MYLVCRYGRIPNRVIQPANSFIAQKFDFRGEVMAFYRFGVHEIGAQVFFIAVAIHRVLINAA